MTAGATLYLVSACGTAEEFVAAFRRYADRTGLFIPSTAPLPAGRRGRLALTLKDGGVMIEGEAEILQSSSRPSVLHGRPGMMVKFIAPDDLSKTVIGELEKARLAMKPAPPSVPPRPADVPAEPRPVVPAVGGRIDAANALAECVVIGDPAQLVDTASAPRSVHDAGSGKAKFIVPSIPGVGGSRPNTPSSPPPMRANTPSTPPPVGDAVRAKTPSIPPDPASKPLPLPTGKSSKMTSVGFPALDKLPAFPPKTNVPGAPTQQAPTHTGPAPAPGGATPAPTSQPHSGPAPAQHMPTAPTMAGGAATGPTQQSPTHTGPAPAPQTRAPTADNPLLQTKMGVKPAANRTKEQAAQSDPTENPLLQTQLGTPGSRAHRPSMNATTHGMPAIAKEPGRPTPTGTPPPPVRAISVNEEATTIGEVPPKPDAAPAAVAKQPSAPTPVAKQPSGPTPTPAAKQPSGPTATPPARPAPPPHAKAHKATSIGFPAVRTPFETQPVGTVRPPPGTVAPPIVPDGNSAKPGAGAPGPRGKNATRPPLTPRHPTPVAPVPIVRSPAKAAPHVDAIVENAIVEEEKTDLSEVPVPPSRTSGVEDTVDAAKANDPNVDPHANTQIAQPPQRSGGMRASEIMAAIPSGDWTMSPDASGPTVIGGVPTPPVVESKMPPKGPPTGNWSISLDPDVGWSEPVKLEKSAEAPKPEPAPAPAPKAKNRKGTGTAGNPDMAVADEKGFMAQEWEEKPTGIGEAKIEIDSTLMEPLKPMPNLDDDADPLSDPPAAGSMPRMATVDGKQITYITPPAGNPVVTDEPSPFEAPSPHPTGASPFAAPPGASPFAAPGATPFGPMTPGPFAAPAPPMTGPVAIAAGYPSTGMPAASSSLFAHSGATGDPNAMAFDYSGAAAKPAGSRKRTIIIGVAALAALAAGFVLVLVLAGGKDKKQSAKPTTEGSGSAAVIDHGSAGSAQQTGSAGSAEAAVAVGSGQGSGSAPDEPDEPDGSGSGSAAVAETPTPPEPATGGPCKVTVTSSPSGADVYQGDKKLGTTPLDTELPCGIEAKITLKKSRFINTGRAFTPAEGKGNKLSIRLAKPTFTLKITSTPAGATITVGGKSMGVTPATIRLPAYESAAIKITKPGYTGESKSVTPKSNNLSQHFVLKKGRR